MFKRATPEEENNPPEGFRVAYEKDPVAGAIGYLVPNDGGGDGIGDGMDGGMSVDPALPPVSGPRMSAAGGRRPYDLSVRLRAPEYTDAVAAMKATAGRPMPRFPVDEGSDEEDAQQGDIAAIPYPETQGTPTPVRPSIGQAKALPEIPSDLMQKLRAAQRRDAVEGGASSLGRLLMATSAGFSGVPTAQALMRDYMDIEKERRGAGRREFGEQQQVLGEEAKRQKDIAEAQRKGIEAELKKKEETSLDDPNSPTAKLYQNVAIRMGIPPEIANRLTERSGKGLLEVFKVDEGGRLRAAFQDAKQQQAVDIQKMREELAIKLEQMRSGDRQAAIDARMLIAALKQQGEGAAGIRAKVDEQRLDFQKEKEADAKVERMTKQIPPQMESSAANLRRIRAIVEANRSNIPGVGVGVGGLPTLFISKEGEDLRQFVDNLKNDYSKERFGTSFTANEEKRLDAALGSISAFKTENQFLNGLQVLEEILYGKLRKSFQGYPRQTVKKYMDRRGVFIPGDPLYGPQGVINQDKVLLRKGDKQVALSPETDAEKIAEAKANGWKEVDL